MLDSCKMVEKQSEAFFLILKHNFIAYRSSKVQIAFLKFTIRDNQGLVGCIPIPAGGVHLNRYIWSIRDYFHYEKELELICLHTNIAIASTQLNGFTYSCLALIILFNINYVCI